MKTCLHVFLLLLLSTPLFSQGIEWNWFQISQNNGESGLSVVEKYNDLLFAAGSTTDTIEFNDTIFNNSIKTAVIYSMQEDGTSNWSKVLRSPKGSHLLDLGIMSNGNIIALVKYGNRLELDDQVLESNNLDSIYSDNHAVVCLDGLGNLEWWRNTSGASPFWGKLAISSGDEIVLSGFCADIENFFSVNPINTLDSSQIWTPWGQSFWTYHHDYFAYLAKLSPTGEPLWVKENGGYVSDVVVNPNGQIFTAGYINEITGFQSTEIVPFGTETGYVCQFNENGDFQWIKRFGGSANDNRMRGIALDPEGNVYATGSVLGNNVQIEGYETIPWSETNGLIVKLNANGDVVWYKLIGIDGWNLDEPNFNSGMCLAYGNDGVFVSGYAYNYINNDGFQLWSEGAPDLFVMHFNENGICNYAKNHVTWGWNMGADILFSEGDVYICGYSYLENWSSAEPSYSIIGKIGASDIILSSKNQTLTKASFSVFPNPCEEFLSVQTGSMEGIEFHIFNSQGQLVHVEKTRGNGSIDIRNLPSGYYLITDISTGLSRSFLKR